MCSKYLKEKLGSEKKIFDAIKKMLKILNRLVFYPLPARLAVTVVIH